jgi:hypothetical protein
MDGEVKFWTDTTPHYGMAHFSIAIKMSYYYQKDVSGRPDESFSKVQNGSWYERAKKNSVKLSLIAVMVAALLLLVGRSNSSEPSTLTTTTFSKMKAATDQPGGFTKRTAQKFSGSSIPSATITVTSPGYSSIDSTSYLPWKTIAEPYRDQEISLSLTSTDGVKMAMKDSGLSVTWSINGETYHGTTSTFRVNGVGIYECTATVYSVDSSSYVSGEKAADSVSYTYSFELAVKYIRREIRALTDSDRETFFDAFVTLYKTSETEGQAKYGSKFHSMDYFNYKHLLGAGMSDCDHWHDGAGILTHHAAVTLAFEQALQSVSSSVSLPYWEYTMDDYLYDNWWNSPVFNDDWFGEANPSTADHSLATGRFAGIKVPSGDKYSSWNISEKKSLNPFVNPYGLMRTPWNLNSSPYFGRRNTTWGYESITEFPTCSTMQGCYNSDSLSAVSNSFVLMDRYITVVYLRRFSIAPMVLLTARFTF